MALRLRKVAVHAWLWTMGILLGLVLVVALALVFLLGTENGRMTLLDQAEIWLPKLTNQTLVIENASAPSLGEWRFGRLEWQQGEQGMKVVADNLVFQFRPRYVLQQRLWVDAFTADSLEIDTPKGQEPTPAKDPNAQPFTVARLEQLWPRIPPIRIEHIQVDALTLNIAERPPLVTSVTSEAEVNWGSWPARMDLRLSGGEDSSLSMTVAVDAVDSIRVLGELNAAADSQWARWSQWPLDEGIAGQWDMELSAANQAYSVDIRSLSLPWRDYRLSAEGGVSYDPNLGRVFLSELTLAVDDHPARLHGFIEAQRADLGIDIERLPLAVLNSLIPIDDLTGDLALNGQVTGGWQAPMFDGSAAFDGRFKGDALALQVESEATPAGMSIETAELTWGEATVAADGRVGWEDRTLDLNLDWQNVNQSRWQPWVAAWPEDVALSTSGEGRLSGALSDPTLTAEVSVDGRYRSQPLQLNTDLTATQRDIELSDLRLSSERGSVSGEAALTFADLSFTATTRLDNVRSSWLDTLNISLPVEQQWGASGELNWSGTLTDPTASGNLKIAGQWQQQPLDSDLTLNNLTLRQLTLGRSRVSLGDAQAQVSGQIDWSQQALDLTADVTTLRLRMLRPFMPSLPSFLDNLKGNTTGEVSVEGPWLEPRVEGDLTFEGEWQQRPLQIALRMQAPTRQTWQVGLAEVNWDGTRVSYQGEVKPFEPSLDGQFEISDLRPQDASAFPVSLPPEIAGLTGAARAAGSISGSLTNPTISAKVGFDGQWRDMDVSLNADIAEVDKNHLALNNLDFQTGDARLAAQGSVQFQPLNFDLNARVNELSWDQLRPWVPTPENLPLETLSAQASGQVDVTGGWPKLNLDGELTVDGQYLQDSFLLDWSGQGDIDGRLTHRLELDWGGATLIADLESEGERVDGQLRLNNFTVERMNALGAPFGPEITGAASANIQMTGPVSDPSVVASIDARGNWRPPSAAFGEGTEWSVIVEAEGQLAEWRIQQAKADLGPAGEVELAGSGTENSIDLTARLDIPELRYWIPQQNQWSGGVSGQVHVAGTPEAPELSADLSWVSAQWPLSLDLAASTESGRHHIQASLNEDRTERLTLDLSTAQTSLSEWTKDFSQRRFEADLTLDADATVLSPLLQDQPAQDFQGQITGRLSIVGSLARPEWEGQARVRNARYENANYGTVLSDLRADLTANNRTLDLSVKARDGNSGNVSLEGTVNWPEGRAEWWMPELDLALETQDAHLLRRADIDASVTGGLDVTGPWHNLLVAGQLDVMPLTIKLDSFLQSGVPSLNVIRAQAETAETVEQRVNPYAPRGRWQVRLTADRRAQIYGQGLEAELSGELDLTDELTNPTVGGRFNVMRGTYTAFGKIFQIEQGNVQVQGSQIVLDISAKYNGPDIDVNLSISGTQDRLNLTMTSEPPMANDELLARLLFGKSIEEMTAIQALQLASALNSLRDPGSGLDLFGTTRDLLGLDTLTVNTGTNEAGESGVNVQAGKYLSNRLYLEVESGVGTEDAFAGSLQYQVTPNVNFEFYTQGQFGAGGVELNWSNDY